jgi:hypothetical protein
MRVIQTSYVHEDSDFQTGSVSRLHHRYCRAAIRHDFCQVTKVLFYSSLHLTGLLMMTHKNMLDLPK